MTAVSAPHNPVLGQPVLTALSGAGGCGRKVAAAELLPLLAGLPTQIDERLLVDSTSCDDAAVFCLGRLRAGTPGAITVW